MPMVPIIIQVISEDGVTDVPITPDTTCLDVVACCRDPGDDVCSLVQVWRGIERVLQDEDRPLEILQEWGPQHEEVKFILRYSVLQQEKTGGARNGMKAQSVFGDLLPDGVELSLWELQEMATRQQEQIESQHQVLVAKEQRLRYLKHQEAKTHQVAAEKERLRRLKERVEAQELKLRKLRALRGQIDQERISNGNLTSDLDSIRALFNEKEKELSLAVAKVEELTRQLEEVKRSGRSRESKPPTSAALELDKLRRELLYRNKLKEQQNAQLNQQRDALSQRQDEIKSMDKRISELQDRLQRKRILNQQLSKQLQQSNNQSKSNKQGSFNYLNGPRQNVNVAAVEPYLHVPNAYHQKGELIKNFTDNDLQKDMRHIVGNKTPKMHLQLDNTSQDKDNNNEYLPEFAGSKTDPKYQTLPSNTRFAGNYGKPLNGENKEPPRVPNHLNPRVYGQDAALISVRSQPIGGSPSSSTSSLATSSSSSSLSNSMKVAKTSEHQGKPISSVAPTTIIPKPIRNSTANDKPSPIYQTSSTKVHPIQPQTLGSTPQGILREVKSNESTPLSPPMTASTPISTPDTDVKSNNTINAINNNVHVNASTPTLLTVATKFEAKPALPPKPALPVKPTPPPPPRQTQINDTKTGYIEITTESLDQALGSINITTRAESGNAESPGRDDEKRAEDIDETDRAIDNNLMIDTAESKTLSSSSIQDINLNHSGDQPTQQQLVRRRKGNLKIANGNSSAGSERTSSTSASRRVSFDPLALLLDASLEGELELVKKTATQVPNPSAANDEGITALHNAICAGHMDIVSFLVEFGCDVNAQDSDGWTPLHCAASCNNLAMVKFLVEHGACIFATTLSDHETAAEKCEEDEEGFDGCSEYLYSIQEKLGILNNGVVYAVYDYTPHNPDELGFDEGDQLVVLRKGDDVEREWWWTKKGDHEGYAPRNLLGLYPRVRPQKAIAD